MKSVRYCKRNGYSLIIFTIYYNIYLRFRWRKHIPETKCFISCSSYNCLHNHKHVKIKKTSFALDFAYLCKGERAEKWSINKSRSKFGYITWPSGEMARYRTLYVCPVSVAICIYKREKVKTKLIKEMPLWSWWFGKPIGLFRKHTTFDIVGYLQTIIWFWEYPCVLTNSFTFLDHTRLQTCQIIANIPIS